MGEGRTGRRTGDGQGADTAAGGSGWTTTDVAARALGVSPRSVRRFIDRGDLQGRKLKEGIVETWEVSIDSLQALRDHRGTEGRVRRDIRQESADPLPDMADLVRDLTADLVRVSSEATEFRVRLELTERAQSTLEKELREERRRREEAERERDELRRRFEAPPEPRDEPQSAPDTSDSPSSSPRSDTVGAQEGVQEPEETARRPWWLRWLGG